MNANNQSVDTAERELFIKWRMDNFLNPPQWDEFQGFRPGADFAGFEAWKGGRDALRAELAGAQVATSSASIDINASLLKLSAETHKSVDDAICALQKLEGIDPIPVQWWSIVSMALYKAYLLGEAEQDRTKPVAAPVEKSSHMMISTHTPGVSG